MRIANDSIDFDDTDMTATRTSEAMWIGHVLNYAIQTAYTGSPVGDFKLQASLDKGDDSAATEALRGAGITTWTDIPSSTQAAGGSAGSVIWNTDNAGYMWVRIVYTFTSGTGTITSARLNTKGI